MAQTGIVLDLCQRAFPDWSFAIKVIKTTGDKLQAVDLTNPNQELPKGLFTKEIEEALLSGAADIAVHSLKDLPTELPAGLVLAAVLPREDVRDVLIYRAPDPSSPLRGFAPHLRLMDLPVAATLGTGSPRREVQLKASRPDLRVVPIRGNVGTRLHKLATQPNLDAIVLALAGLRRLGLRMDASGNLNIPAGPVGDRDEPLPEHLMATPLPFETMLPCVGQGAIAIEARVRDDLTTALCARLNHRETMQCISAERAFLRAMGGGCQSPVAALASIESGQLRLRAVSFEGSQPRRGEDRRSVQEADALGKLVAAQLKAQP